MHRAKGPAVGREAGGSFHTHRARRAKRSANVRGPPLCRIAVVLPKGPHLPEEAFLWHCPLKYRTYETSKARGRMMSPEPVRTARIEARIAPDALAIVKRAAEIQGRSVSDFVAAAQEAAQRTIERTE